MSKNYSQTSKVKFNYRGKDVELDISLYPHKVIDDSDEVSAFFSYKGYSYRFLVDTQSEIYKKSPDEYFSEIVIGGMRNVIDNDEIDEALGMAGSKDNKDNKHGISRSNIFSKMKLLNADGAGSRFLELLYSKPKNSGVDLLHEFIVFAASGFNIAGWRGIDNCSSLTVLALESHWLKEQNESMAIAAAGFNVDAWRGGAYNHSTSIPLIAEAARLEADKSVIEVAKLLIEFGVFLDQRPITRRTALTIAISAGSIGLATLLIESGADINLEGRGYVTPLSCAVDRGRTEIVPELLKRGAVIDSKISEKNPPILKELYNLSTQLLDIIKNSDPKKDPKGEELNKFADSIKEYQPYIKTIINSAIKRQDALSLDPKLIIKTLNDKCLQTIAREVIVEDIKMPREMGDVIASYLGVDEKDKSEVQDFYNQMLDQEKDLTTAIQRLLENFMAEKSRRATSSIARSALGVVESSSPSTSLSLSATAAQAPQQGQQQPASEQKGADGSSKNKDSEEVPSATIQQPSADGPKAEKNKGSGHS